MHMDMLCFVLLWLFCHFLWNQLNIFINLLQSCLAGTGAMIWSPNINWVILAAMSNIGPHLDKKNTTKTHMWCIHLGMQFVNGNAFIWNKTFFQIWYQHFVCWWPIANMLNRDAIYIKVILTLSISKSADGFKVISNWDHHGKVVILCYSPKWLTRLLTFYSTPVYILCWGQNDSLNLAP